MFLCIFLALNDVAFSVNEKEIFGVIGPNGAGKTTLFNVVSGFNTPTKGNVIFRDTLLNGKAVDQISQLGIARTFQNIRVFGDISVCENVLTGMHNQIHTSLLSTVLHSRQERTQEKLAREKAMELLAYLGIEQFADEYASNLSYGVQRKVEIARALASNPYLLMLDEPSAGMNEQETMALMELIKDINKKFGITIIVIEHNMNFIMNLCERIAVLNFGELMMLGAPAEVQSDSRVLEAYIGKGGDDV